MYIFFSSRVPHTLYSLVTVLYGERTVWKVFTVRNCFYGPYGSKLRTVTVRVYWTCVRFQNGFWKLATCSRKLEFTLCAVLYDVDFVHNNCRIKPVAIDHKFLWFIG